MLGKEWTVVKVPYGCGYCSLNLARPKEEKSAPDALQKEFRRLQIFTADNGAVVSGARWDNIDIKVCHLNTRDGWEQIDTRLVHSASNLFRRQNNLLFIGGSHTVTYSTFRAMANIFGPQFGLIIFDAHPDCCRKADWPIHSDWLRHLIENYCVLPENVLIIGLRQVEKSEKEFLKKYDVRPYYMSSARGISDLTTGDNFSVMADLYRFRQLKAVYMSIDIDVVSGVFTPGTGCPSPGGFTDREIISLAKQFKNALPNLKAADIVEIGPLKWWQKKILRYDATVDLGVKLIKEIIS